MELKNVAKLPLDIPKGYYVVCVMQTQAAYTYKVRLADENDADLILPMTRRSQEALPPECAALGAFNANRCEVVIEVSESRNLDVRMAVNDFNGVDDSTVVRSYTIIAEDADDADYNDLFLTVTAYKKRW